jgi:hypothetical protein
MIEIATLDPLASESIEDYKIDTSALQSLINNYPSATLTSGPYPSLNVGVGSASGSLPYSTGGTYFTTNGTSGSPWQNLTMTNNHQPSSLNVKGDAEFEGKVKVNGQDLGEFMETISKRLAILVPDPAKLEHFEALKKAYDHYKMLEQLCELPKEEKE